jgi:hypothetical protein
MRLPPRIEGDVHLEEKAQEGQPTQVRAPQGRLRGQVPPALDPQGQKVVASHLAPLYFTAFFIIIPISSLSNFLVTTAKRRAQRSRHPSRRGPSRPTFKS